MDALLTAASTVAGVLVQIFDLAALSIGNASAALALTSYATGLCIPVVKEIDTFTHVRNNVIPHQPLEWLKATIQLRILNYTSDWRDGFVLQVLFVTETPFDLFPRFDVPCSSRTRSAGSTNSARCCPCTSSTNGATASTRTGGASRT